MVNNIRKIESILEKYEKKCFKVEKNRKKIRRSIYSTKKFWKIKKLTQQIQSVWDPLIKGDQH